MTVQAITQAQIDALKTTLKANFMAGLALGKETWPMVAALIKSDSKSNTYAWLTQFPQFREWVGSRLHKLVAEKAYTVNNRKFETTIDIQRTEIEDDAFGQYRPSALPKRRRYGHSSYAKQYAGRR
jgi:phage major head subunit gpT-like protein